MFIWIKQKTTSLISLYESTTLLFLAKQNLFIYIYLTYILNYSILQLINRIIFLNTSKQNVKKIQYIIIYSGNNFFTIFLLKQVKNSFCIELMILIRNAFFILELTRAALPLQCKCIISSTVLLEKYNSTLTLKSFSF